MNGLPPSAVRTRGIEEAALARASLLKKAPDDARRQYETGREYQELALNIQADSAKWGLVRTGQSLPAVEALPRYGWWGGKGGSGGRGGDRQPINSMDRVFRRHDDGYKAAGTDATKIRSADEALVTDLQSIDREALANEQLFRDAKSDFLYLDAAIRAFSAKIAVSRSTGS